MTPKRNSGGLDIFRLVAAFLVVAIHTSPLSSFSAEADFFLTRIAARTAVPFFLMVTGQFVLSDCLFHPKGDHRLIWKYIGKIGLLYGAAALLYLPVGLYAGQYDDLSAASAIRMILIDGPFYHLWYFPACITGVVLVYGLRRFLSLRGTVAAAAVLYVIGLFGDSYYGLIAHVPLLSDVYEAGFQLFSYTRNGFFLAPVFLILGAWLGSRRDSGRLSRNIAGLALSLLLMTIEGFALRYFQVQRHDSMYLALLPCMVFLYRLLLSWNVRPRRVFRTLSTGMYLLHPLMIVAVRGAAKVLGQTGLLVENSLVHYGAVCAVSFAFSAVFAAFMARKRKPEFLCGRAWIELDRSALQYNVSALRTLLPEDCALMPAVKADAYGHGAVLIARELNRMGIRTFCVASVLEGRELRQNGIKGEILVLGYTHPRQFPLLRRYRLTQTVVDYAYAVLLNLYGRKLPVHIGVDTGMHRLGERCENVDKLCRIYQMKNLRVEGLFTHLCADDTKLPADEAFTKAQIQDFYTAVGQLRERGFPCPKIHVLSSYGLLNYSGPTADYVRVGIALYGVLSTRADTQECRISLKPVLSLKARVAAVKDLYRGEAVGYGRQFVADHDMKIAVLSIGYADGLPRSLSDGEGAVLIDGCRAPIVGRICMDQMTVDVSDIPQVLPGAVAVIIGQSGEEAITVGDWAEQTGTITNEILSRMGARLERVIV